MFVLSHDAARRKVVCVNVGWRGNLWIIHYPLPYGAATHWLFAPKNYVTQVFICIYYYIFSATASMKLFRTAANSACRPSTHQLRRNSSFRRISLSGSPTRSRSSLSSVPATPWSQSALDKDAKSGNAATTAKRAAKAPKTAYIALGSNMGDRIGMIEQACNTLTSRGITVKRTSSLWETEPMYVLDQENFINGACEVSEKHLLYCFRLSIDHVVSIGIHPMITICNTSICI
jgi:hypothetical protein